MKKTLNIFTALFITVIFFSACDKNAIPELTQDVAADGAFVKFFLQVENAPSINFYLGDQKVSAVNSSTTDDVQGSDYGTVYPSNAYAIIPAGNFDVNAKNLEGNVIATTEASFSAAENYTAYLVGTTENYEVFVMKDQLPPDDRIKIYWRFVNTMANMPFKVDFYAIRDAQPATGGSPAQSVEVVSLGNSIGFKEAGEYKELQPGNYTFKVFESGSDYDPETSEAYLENSVNLGSKGRTYSTQIRGEYSENPVAKNIDFWRER